MTDDKAAARPRRGSLVAIALAGLGLLAPVRAFADPPPAGAPGAPGAPADQAPSGPKPLSDSLSGMAKAEYEAGKILYGDRDYANAIVKFQHAYDLSKDPRLLWNVAVCEKNLRRYAKMLATIQRYKKDGASMLTDDEKARAEEIIKTVATFVSALTVRVAEDGAEVFIDDEKVGTSPLAGPITVDVGTRKIRAVKPGFRPAEVQKPVPGGGALSVDIAMEKEVHRGKLLVNAGQDDLISLDGKVIGRGRWEGSVPSGGHQLKVSAPGMTPYQSEAVVQDAQTRRIDVTLQPVPRTDGTRTILWVVGGTVLAAGAAVGGFFLFKPTEAPSVTGSINPGNVQLNFGGRR
ncbi:MAG: PEGA domain-containing protein [Byssovorax sp.]